MPITLTRARRAYACTLAVGCLCGASARAQVPFTLPPSQDAFVRAAAPTLNYGAAGALCVSGPIAVNSQNEMQGQFDTVLQFNLAPPAAAFDAALGAANWLISSARLRVNEVGAPFNLIFNRGVGTFEVRWLSNDDWVEGPGTPQFDTVGTGNQMTWDLLQAILPGSTEALLGAFDNTGTSGSHTYPLGLPAAFAGDLRAGGLVSLHLVAASGTIGFTFNAVDYLIANSRPVLLLAAVSREDFDYDGDVDLADYATLFACLTGPAAPLLPNCERADLDADDDDADVDLADAAIFERYFTQP